MELQKIFAPLLRWWWLLVAAAAVAAIFSLIVGLKQPAVYQTSTTLMIGQTINDPNPSTMQIYTIQQLATTYADIAARRTIREATMTALGLNWLPRYIVRPVSNTQLLEIVVNDTDPARAQAVATELAKQMILQSPTSRPEDQARQGFISQQLDDLEQKITETQAEIDARQSELSNLTSARQIADTQNQIYALQTKLDTLRNNYTNLLANTLQGALNTLTVIEPAVLPEAPVGPNVPLMVVTAASFALAVAVGATYLLEYLDNTLKSTEEIKRLTGLPLLVGIPNITGEMYHEKLVTIKHPRSPISEAYRSLRTAVQFFNIDNPDNNALLVTSPSPSEGKSVTAANLATVIAQAGLKVLLIDADLRRPVLHRIFELQNHTGLTDLLRNIKLNDVDGSVVSWWHNLAQPTTTEGLWVLTSGPIPPNPSEILGSKTNQIMLKSLKQHFDYIIMDSPPVLIVTDAIVLSTQVDGTILVMDADNTQKNQLRESVERMREVNANLLGVVVNRLSPKMDGSLGYYHYSYYRKAGNSGYGYQTDEEGSNRRGFRGSGKFRMRGAAGNQDEPK